MNSLASVHAWPVVINSICDGVGFSDPPAAARHRPSRTCWNELDNRHHIILSVSAQPEPYRYEEWPAAINLVILGFELRGCSSVIDDYIQGSLTDSKCELLDRVAEPLDVTR